MKTLQFLLLAATVTGCATTKPENPEVQLFSALPQGRETPIFVTAARQKEEIKLALQEAGFRIVDRIGEETVLMRATIGIDQDSKACGTFNNVRFQFRADNRNIAEANAKGWTGSCQPNILRDISHELWQQFSNVSHTGVSQ